MLSPASKSLTGFNANGTLVVRILHVDCDVSFCNKSKAVLEAHGLIHVDIASSVEEATEKINQQPYDAIVSAQRFQRKDGLTFLTELRQSGNSVPFILFTLKSRAEVALNALNLGADGYVNKIGDDATVFGELTFIIRQAVEKRRISEALKKSEAELHAQFESPPDLVMIIDRNYRFVRVNHVTYSSPDAEELIGQEAIIQLPPSQRELVKSKLDACFATGDIQEIQHTITGDRWIQARIVPLLTDGIVNQVMVISTDITKTKLAEEKLRRHMERGLFLIQLYTKALHLNQKELHQYFLTQAIRLSGSTVGFFHFISEDQKTIILTAWNDETLKTCSAQYNTHYPIEQAGNWIDCVRLKRPVIYNDFANSPNQTSLPEGHTPLTRFMSIPIMENEKVIIIFVVGNKIAPYEEEDAVQIQLIANELHKILKHRRLEDALRESEEKYRGQFEEAMDAIVLADAQTGLIVDCNSATSKLLGKEKSEIIGASLISLHPRGEDVDERGRFFKQHIMERNTQVLEDIVVTKTGELKPVEIKASFFTLGEKVFIQSILRDVTERKDAEEKLNTALEALAIINEKISMVGSLTRHDVRNKLSVINSYVYLAKKKVTNNPELIQYLNGVESAVAQTVYILNFSKTYEQIGVEQLVPINAGTAFDEAIQLTSDLKNVKVDNECSEIVVVADSLLRQLFYNLIDNSLRHGKTVKQIRLYFQRPSAKQMQLIYEDNGEGIPNDVKPKIFGEGFSTEKGSGYGLFVIKKIVECYGWTINEDGEFGKGARFTITLPVSSQ